MSLNPNVVMLGVAAPLTVFYCLCGMARKRRLQYDNVLFFGFLCAGMVRGIYILVEAIRTGASGNGLYTGLFGLTVALVSAERVKSLIQAKLRKTPGRRTSKPEADSSE